LFFETRVNARLYVKVVWHCRSTSADNATHVYSPYNGNKKH